MVSRQKKQILHSLIYEREIKGNVKTLKEVQQFAHQTTQLNDRFQQPFVFSFVNESFISGFV